MKWKTPINILGFTICRTKKLAETIRNYENQIENLRRRINQMYYNN